MNAQGASGEWIPCQDRLIGPYLALLPHPLPPKLDAERLWVSLEMAAAKVGALDDLVNRLPDPGLLILYPGVREAHASARVEGTTTTLAQALGFEERPSEPETLLDFTAIQDHLAAQQAAIERSRSGEWTLSDLLPIHERLLRHHAEPERAQPGCWRRRQVIVPGEHPGLMHARHVPPPAHEVAGCLASLERYLHDHKDAPEWVAAALVHAQFELIHPFGDGNGRMGRILILMQLLSRGALKYPTLFLSDYFRVHRTRYFDLLTAVVREGAWSAWVQFFLVGVAEVASAAIEVAERILSLRAQLERDLPAVSQGQAARVLLRQLFLTPRISVAKAAELTNIPAPTLYPVFRAFVQRGWLRKAARRSAGTEYVFQAYWDVLSDAGRLEGGDFGIDRESG